MKGIYIRTPVFKSAEEAEKDLADRLLKMFRDGVGGGVAVRSAPWIVGEYDGDRGTDSFVGTARFATLPDFVKENEDGSITFKDVFAASPSPCASAAPRIKSIRPKPGVNMFEIQQLAAWIGARQHSSPWIDMRDA